MNDLLADIRRVANEIFVPSNCTTAEIDYQAPTAAANNKGGAQ